MIDGRKQQRCRQRARYRALIPRVHLDPCPASLMAAIKRRCNFQNNNTQRHFDILNRCFWLQPFDQHYLTNCNLIQFIASCNR